MHYTGGICNTCNDGACITDADCNDDNVCNGTETCDINLGCQSGTPLDVDDGVSCTVDSCDAELGIIHTAMDSICDDGLFCNGVETCDPVLDCQAGTAPVVDDGLFCTDDSCDEELDEIVHTPIDVDDGLFCTDDSCDEVADEIVHTPVDVDDGVACTNDSCDEVNDVILHEEDNFQCADGGSCTVPACNARLGCEYIPMSE
ncbi:MAG: hypothetical protein H6765_10525 [Candidatus Peribacteria bacterium]|nr:MAG: hypothetical protein H6765_10525 [Candidatus Peribacteria bacterium]